MLPLVITLLAAFTSLTLARSPYDVPKAEWDALNTTVGGRLAYGVPLARSCFAQAGVNVTGSAMDCATVQAKYGLDTFRVTQFGATMRTQWETCQKTSQGCLLDATKPSNAAAFSAPRVCNQGSVPPYYISVKTAADVTQAFSFSNRTGVPLSIKNTGHDFAGKSMAPGTLSLWTHNIKYINYSTTFVPEGCSVPGVPALTYGAGQDMDSLFLFAETNNITFIGGSAKTVGAAGGWLMGGGHSVLSNTYGLGVDRVLQFKIVTPDGQVRTANACKETDLFWALRGGGGGTFGVVLEATSEVVPQRVATWALKWQLNPTTDVQGLAKAIVANSLQWSRDGWGGYIYPTTSILANPKLNATQAAASLKPLTDFIKSSGGTSSWTRHESFLPLYTDIMSSPVAVGINGAIASRLVSQNVFIQNQTALLDATLKTLMLSEGRAAFYMTTPFSYAAKVNATSVTPAWRGAVWHVVTAAEWGWNADVDTIKKTYINVNATMGPLRDLTPGGGAYQNEANVYESNAVAAFWGWPNYTRLYGIKQRYDPKGLLNCFHCGERPSLFFR
ncbi:hypothetical protein FRC12_004022 [Ceratobasidium sp. 428]|nr:hypothetical protein FRC12_004022 [Ceratobasidium sp. 428]